MVFMPHWPQMLGSKPIDLGLERIEKLLEKLGNPQDKLPPVVHVAGTNGKGSTIAFLRAFLEEAGYKCHVYISPHLREFNERITVAGEKISEQMLHNVIEETRIAAEENNIKVTFFEGTTAAAFLAFAKVKADIVLLETGLGGRLDATNVVKHPALNILTPISLDHTEYLGPTVHLIANEKLGIIKKGTTCISSMQYDEVAKLIEEKVVGIGNELYAFSYDWMVEKDDNGFIYKSQKGDMYLPYPALKGDHQLINAGTAIAASQMLKDFSVSEEHIKKGLLSVKWQGRLEQVKKGPVHELLEEDWELWIDGAHNSAASHVLAGSISDWKDKPIYLVCGMTKGRNVTEFLTPFKGIAKKAYGVVVQSEPSALSSAEILNGIIKNEIEGDEAETVYDAVYKIIKKDSIPGRILILGSLYLAKDVIGD